MSNTDYFCDLCGGRAEEHYLPVGSKRGAKVVVCTCCGLVSTVFASNDGPRAPSLSCDADWGQIRHGKGVRLNPTLRALEPFMSWGPGTRVLDVGANRGDFALWVESNHPQAAITAIEPDGKLVERYAGRSGIDLTLAYVEDVDLPAAHFDLIYCVQTLEHCDSPRKVMQQLASALKVGGLLVLEVPNLDAISDRFAVEEFFIDRHRHHFNRALLCDFVSQLGFEILAGQGADDAMNITLVLRRSDAGTAAYTPGATPLPAANIAALQAYRDRLPVNRGHLQEIVAKQLGQLMLRQKVAFWGAGRIFDALVKYGSLEPEKVHSLVDRFLWDKVERSHGIPIQSPDALKDSPPDVVIVLARSSADQIVSEVRGLGIRHAFKLNDLMAQSFS